MTTGIRTTMAMDTLTMVGRWGTVGVGDGAMVDFVGALAASVAAEALVDSVAAEASMAEAMVAGIGKLSNPLRNSLDVPAISPGVAGAMRCAKKGHSALAYCPAVTRLSFSLPGVVVVGVENNRKQQSPAPQC